MWELLPKLLAGGGAGAAIAVVYLYTTGTVIPGHIYRGKCDDCDRERQRADKADEVLLQSIPLLDRAMKALDKVPDITRTAVEVVRKNDGQ